MKDRLIKKIAELSAKAIQGYTDRTAPDELFQAICAINEEVAQFDQMRRDIKSQRTEQDSALFAKQLVSWLKRLGVTQARLAREIEITPSWLNKCIKGEATFSRGVKRDIKEFLIDYKRL